MRLDVSSNEQTQVGAGLQKYPIRSDFCRLNTLEHQERLIIKYLHFVVSKKCLKIFFQYFLTLFTACRREAGRGEAMTG
jgi:hypothetical protein